MDKYFFDVYFNIILELWLYKTDIFPPMILKIVCKYYVPAYLQINTIYDLHNLLFHRALLCKYNSKHRYKWQRMIIWVYLQVYQYWMTPQFTSISTKSMYKKYKYLYNEKCCISTN